MGITEIRNHARQALHEFMGRPACYVPDPVDPAAFTTTKARPHSKRGQIGDLPGTNLNYAEVIDRVEKLVLWAEDVPTPARGGLVILSATEGYWIESVDPTYGQTITVNVISATAAELTGMPVPGA